MELYCNASLLCDHSGVQVWTDPSLVDAGVLYCAKSVNIDCDWLTQVLPSNQALSGPMRDQIRVSPCMQQWCDINKRALVMFVP